VKFTLQHVIKVNTNRKSELILWFNVGFSGSLLASTGLILINGWLEGNWEEQEIMEKKRWVWEDGVNEGVKPHYSIYMMHFGE